MLRMSGAKKKQEAARQARLEREAAERAARERAKRLKLLGGAGAAIVVIVALVLALGLFRDDATKDASGGKVEVDGQTVEVKGVDETTTLFSGLPQNGRVLGDPNAPATIVEIADLKCPACQLHEIETQPEIINSLVKPGKANLEIVLVNFRDAAAGTTDGEAARNAAHNLVASNTFFPFVHMLYYNQGNESETWATDRKLKAIGEATPGVGADKIDTAETPESKKETESAEKLSTALNPTGTPSLYVKARGTNEYTHIPNFTSIEDITAAVDEATKKAKATR